ncbi:hypothetical protein C5167_045413 [Papaver somniferum]|uniref:Uncharacterized protein n=1 Tax=Papaver somniferum TaxID=3469 RepID=A0A4Y7LC90_PAPSO|nr:uncharacterized protein LOC113321340 [Papaver somniferum]RZC82627.1 hypothetical protein C5167_045413 [Papaver somniferum]
MALKNVAKMLSRRYSSGTTSVVTKNGGFETKHIRDDRVRRIAERLEQATEKTKRLTDECNAIFALRRAFSMDRIIWLGLIMSIGDEIHEQFKTIQDIKAKDAQLSACLTKRQ